MWRYYSWDIEWKFWFGSQSSDDWEFFWAEALEPCEIEYYVDWDKLEFCKKQIEVCKTKLKPYYPQLTKLLSRPYNEEHIARDLGITVKKAETLVQWYARLELGNKIYKCLVENGSCSFDAEI
jgi:hypothetical protein